MRLLDSGRWGLSRSSWGITCGGASPMCPTELGGLVKGLRLPGSICGAREPSYPLLPQPNVKWLWPERVPKLLFQRVTFLAWHAEESPNTGAELLPHQKGDIAMEKKKY